jgi:caa(3)-type oxidase subunit IV
VRIVYRDPVIVVWIALALATFLSWWLSTEEASDGRLIAVIILIVAGVKIRLVGLYFMELRDAPALLRGAFEIYVFVLSGVLAGYVAVT